MVEGRKRERKRKEERKKERKRERERERERERKRERKREKKERKRKERKGERKKKKKREKREEKERKERERERKRGREGKERKLSFDLPSKLLDGCTMVLSVDRPLIFRQASNALGHPGNLPSTEKRIGQIWGFMVPLGSPFHEILIFQKNMVGFLLREALKKKN
jgi:hypothetical protein